MKVLGFSEASACGRLDIARKGRLYPGIFRRLADGSLHLTGASMLADHLTTANAEELLTTSAHRTHARIEQLLAERFPQADLPTRLVPLVPLPVAFAAAAPTAANNGHGCLDRDTSESATPPFVPDLDNSPALARVNLQTPDDSPAPARINVRVPRPRVKPLAPDRPRSARDSGPC